MVHTRPEWFHFIDQIINWLSIIFNKEKSGFCCWLKGWSQAVLVCLGAEPVSYRQTQLKLLFFFFFPVSSAFVLREIIEQEVWTISSWASWLVVEYDWLSHSRSASSICSSIKMANDAVGLMAACLLWPLPSDICQTHFGGNGTHEMLWTNQEAAFKSSILVKVPSMGQWQVFESEHLFAFFG